MVVGHRMRVGPSHRGAHERRPAPRPAVRHRLATHIQAVEEIVAIGLEVEEPRIVADDGRERSAGSLHFHRDRDRVSVVLDQEEDRELLHAGGGERLPELALGGRPVADRDVDHFVVMEALGPTGNRFDEPVVPPGLGAAHRLQALGSGRARLGNHVQSPVPPVARHLPASGVGVRHRSDSRQEHFLRRHAEREEEGTIPVVGIEPVVGRTGDFPGGDQDRLVAGARDLKVVLVQPLELHLLVVDGARQEHEPIIGDELAGLEAGKGGSYPRVHLGQRSILPK